MKSIAPVLLLGAVFMYVTPLTLAQQPRGNLPGGGAITITNPLSCEDALCVVQAILGALFRISIPIVSLMILVGAFQLMTSSGDPEKVTRGRKTIIYAVVGFAIILLSSGLVYIIAEVVGSSLSPSAPTPASGLPGDYFPPGPGLPPPPQ